MNLRLPPSKLIYRMLMERSAQIKANDKEGRNNMSTKPQQQLYIKFTEYNGWEGETWRFYIPATADNLIAARRLHGILKSAGVTEYKFAVYEQNGEEQFITYTAEYLHQLISDSSDDDEAPTYMDGHNLLEGRLVLPDALNGKSITPNMLDDHLYKGAIRKMMVSNIVSSTEPQKQKRPRTTKRNGLERTAVATTHAPASKSTKGASPEWRDLARQAIERVANRNLEFTSDDVWAELTKLGAKGSFDNRALGGIIRAAAASGVCRATNRVRPTTRPESHRRPIAIWTSLHYDWDYRPGYDKDDIRDYDYVF